MIFYKLFKTPNEDQWVLEPAPQGMGAPKAEISDKLNQQLLPNSALSTNVS